MSGFVASAPAQPTTDPGDTIANDGWFPDVSMADTRNAMRIDGTITAPRLRAALQAAILHVNQQLSSLQDTQQALGFSSLAEAGAGATLDGQPRMVLLYQRAVMCTAKADLTERYRDFDADNDNSRARDSEPMIDEQRRNAQWAIRDMLGQRRTVVELI